MRINFGLWELFLDYELLLLRSGMLRPRMVSPVVWKKRRWWSSEGPPCFPTAVLAALKFHGASAAFLLFSRGGRSVEHILEMAK